MQQCSNAGASTQAKLIAVPLTWTQQTPLPHCATSIDVRIQARENPQQTTQYLSTLFQGAKWLEFYARTRAYPPLATDQYSEPTPALLHAVAITAGSEQLAQAMVALVEALAINFNCDNVSIGLAKTPTKKHYRIEVQAISGSSQFSTQHAKAKALENLMEEAIDLDHAIVFPACSDLSSANGIAHRHYSRDNGHCQLCSIPLFSSEEIVGAINFQRQYGSDAFNPKELLSVEQIGLLLGPILAHRLSSQRPLQQQLKHALSHYSTAAFGPKKLTLKLFLCTGLFTLLFFSLADGNFRVSADASLAGRIERLIPAPEDGFIKSVAVKPGDTVFTGQPLAALEDSELRLEQKNGTAKAYRWPKNTAALWLIATAALLVFCARRANRLPPNWRWYRVSSNDY